MAALAGTVPRYVEAVTVFADSDSAGQNGAGQLVKNIIAIGNAEIFIAGGA
jgi:hypothetical protein